MPKPRKNLVCVEATPYYHCISRCVRRAYLCGDDPVSGASFDHRKGWLVDRILELSAIFAIDVCAYSVMSNHFHVILRVDRERVRSWGDEEIAARMERVFPVAVAEARGMQGQAYAARVARWRDRLWSISWYMRCLNESIARRANAEDGCSGRFWEGRFKSQALLDEGALLTCMAYVDLNPIRAGIAQDLMGSDYTSIQERLLRLADDAMEPIPREAPGAAEAASVASPEVGAPSACRVRAPLLPCQDEAMVDDYWTALGSRYEPSTPLRLPIDRADYLELLNSTADLVNDDPDQALPEPLMPALECLNLSASAFVRAVADFDCTFFTMVGEVHRIDLECHRRGYRRRLGRRAALRLYKPRAA